MLKIGEKIKELRKAQDVTQEKLADYLNISYQAISKWENGLALPDITLLPKLSSFFGVSTDWLLGADWIKTDMFIEDTIIKAVNYKKEGKSEQAIHLLEKTLLQYPNNFLLISELIETKVQRFTNKDNEIWLDDIVKKSNIVLDNCTDDAIRYKVKTNLAFAYSFCNKREDAEMICDTFPEVAYSKIEMYSMIAPPKERIKYKKGCVGRDCESIFIDMLSIAKHHYCFAEAKNALPICEMVIKIIDIMGNEGFLKFHKAEAFADMANAYAKLQDKGNTLKYMKKAFNEYLEMDILSETETVYKTPILEGQTFGKDKITYWNGESASQNYLYVISNRRTFTFLKEDADYIELFNKLKSRSYNRNNNL